MVIVVLDACVLFPPSLRDLLLTLAALDAYEVRWNEVILSELTRAVCDRYPDVDKDAFRSTTIAAMNAAFPDALVRGWEQFVTDMDNDPDDRHVAATAVATGTNAIVTFNVRHFRGMALTFHGIGVVTPGELVTQCLDDLPERALEAVNEMARRTRNPPMTIDDMLEKLSGHPGLDGPITRLRHLLD